MIKNLIFGPYFDGFYPIRICFEMKLFIRFFEIEFFYSCKAILKILSVSTVQKRENFSEFYLFPIAFWSFICYIKSTIIFYL